MLRGKMQIKSTKSHFATALSSPPPDGITAFYIIPPLFRRINWTQEECKGPEMARGGGREYAERWLRDGQVDRHGLGRMGTEVATQGQGPSGWAAEKRQGGGRTMGPSSPCFVIIFTRWGTMAV